MKPVRIMGRVYEHQSEDGEVTQVIARYDCDRIDEDAKRVGQDEGVTLVGDGAGQIWIPWSELRAVTAMLSQARKDKRDMELDAIGWNPHAPAQQEKP